MSPRAQDGTARPVVGGGWVGCQADRPTTIAATQAVSPVARASEATGGTIAWVRLQLHPEDFVTDVQLIRGSLAAICRRWAGVASATCGNDGRTALLHEAEHELSSRRPPGLRQQFCAGRTAAHTALSRLGIAGYAPILEDEDGVPLFPGGTLGSISHKNGAAVALATYAQPWLLGVGVDLEVDVEHDEDALCEGVLAQGERGTLFCDGEPNVRSAGTLVLAAKEAVYKSVFPTARRVLDFDEIELTFITRTRSFACLRLPGSERLAVHGGYETSPPWLVAFARACRAEGV